MKESTTKLINDIKHWFVSHDLDTAVVGYSGGVDSSTTAALCSKAGLRVELVQCEAIESYWFSPQKYSSDYPVEDFSELFDCNYSKYEMFGFQVSEGNNPFNEAALPIMRVAYFYGKAAELRDRGFKPLVIGTTNFDESSYLGFFGKSSDASHDFYPISHLHKSEVREIAKELGVPDEIIYAEPSGDLLWSGDLNDYKMIGATYDQIEALAKYVDNLTSPSVEEVGNFIITHIDNPKLFCTNIKKNAFKYELPFPQFHLHSKLEIFRYRYYNLILHAANQFLNDMRTQYV